MFEIKNIKKYSHSLFDETSNSFSFFKNNEPVILSTSFGVQLNYLLNNLDLYPKEKISNNLESQQIKENGFFIDSNFAIQNLGKFDADYLRWQSTYFATIAIDMLGFKPKYNFDFLEKYKNNEYLEKWFTNLNFKNFWLSSNKLMFLLYFLTYEKEKLHINNDNSINLVFNLLNKTQDKNTGYWGTNQGASLLNGMFGAAHIYLFYRHHDQKINYKNTIITNTIKLQNINGLYGSKNGGACEDYNATDILFHLFKYGKKDEIKLCINKLYKAQIHEQRNNGGFSYKIDNRNSIDKIKNILKPKNCYYTYSGLKNMKSNYYKSDLWATYFRTLSIAKIEKMLEINNYDYKFYNLPGWGY